MSKPSLNNSTNTQNMKDIQGGEKKVMKKSLTVLLSSAMALSMFSSVAFGKTSTDFTDLKDLSADQKAIFDAMISAGYFDGVTNTTFGLNDDMNRAQFAKIAAKLLGLDATGTTSTFTDVKATDPANGYAVGAIQALKVAGVTDGVTDTTFDPAGKVTKEQLAAFLIRAMGKDAEARLTPGVSDATVSTWAKGYVAFALNAKVVTNGTDGTFGGTTNAPRSLLVTASYAAQGMINVVGKASVTEAKAAGVKTVTVTFNKAVDTAKATLALTKGTVAVATTTVFAADKKSATLTLTDTSVRAGDYTVTLGGLDAAAVDKTTATFTAQDEAVQKIEFVNASDTLAQTTAAGKYANIKLKASNQYGENASASAGSYSVLSSGNGMVPNKITKDINGNLIVGLDTSGQTVGIGMVSVTIINSDSHVSASKNFKIGTAPLLSKIELGAPVYSVGTAISGTGQNAKYALNMLDQYGNLISFDQLGTAATDIPLPQVIWNDYLDAASINVVTEDDGNNLPVLKISLLTNVDKTADYNFTVIDQAASTTGKLSITSAKIATKIQIGDLNDVIAAHDQDVYIPVIAFDAQGAQLSVEDLVSSANLARITVAVAGASNPNTGSSGQGIIEATGEHKGTIHLKNISDTKNGAVSVNAFIATANASSTASKTYTIQAARVPDHFKETTAPAKTGIVGSYSAFEYDVIDQYGKKLDTSWNVDSQGNYSVSGSHYKIVVTANSKNANSANVPTTIGAANLGNVIVTADTSNGPAVFNLANPVEFGNAEATDFSGFNKAFRFLSTTGSTGNSVQLIASLRKDGVEISKLDKTFTATAAVSSSNLTYSLNSVAPLWNAMDSGLIYTQNDIDGVTASVYANDLTDTMQKSAVVGTSGSKFRREISVTAKNAAGEKVAVPYTVITPTSSNTSIAQVAVDTTNHRAYVIGNKAGTATVGVSFTAADGSIKQLYTDVTVKNDALSVASVSWDDSTKTRVIGTSVFAGLNITDNYGIVYEDSFAQNGLASAQGYNYLLGTTFSVANITGGTVSLDQYGRISGTAGTKFDLIVTSASGKTASQAVTLSN